MPSFGEIRSEKINSLNSQPLLLMKVKALPHHSVKITQGPRTKQLCSFKKKQLSMTLIKITKISFLREISLFKIRPQMVVASLHSSILSIV